MTANGSEKVDMTRINKVILKSCVPFVEMIKDALNLEDKMQISGIFKNVFKNKIKRLGKCAKMEQMEPASVVVTEVDGGEDYEETF